MEGERGVGEGGGERSGRGKGEREGERGEGERGVGGGKGDIIVILVCFVPQRIFLIVNFLRQSAKVGTK